MLETSAGPGPYPPVAIFDHSPECTIGIRIQAYPHVTWLGLKLDLLRVTAALQPHGPGALPVSGCRPLCCPYILPYDLMGLWDLVYQPLEHGWGPCNPQGIVWNWYKPKVIAKAVFSLDFNVSRIYQYPFVSWRVITYRATPNQSASLSTCSMWYVLNFEIALNHCMIPQLLQCSALSAAPASHPTGVALLTSPIRSLGFPMVTSCRAA